METHTHSVNFLLFLLFLSPPFAFYSFTFSLVALSLSVSPSILGSVFLDLFVLISDRTMSRLVCDNLLIFFSRKNAKFLLVPATQKWVSATFSLLNFFKLWTVCWTKQFDIWRHLNHLGWALGHFSGHFSQFSGSDQTIVISWSPSSDQGKNIYETLDASNLSARPH